MVESAYKKNEGSHGAFMGKMNRPLTDLSKCSGMVLERIFYSPIKISDKTNRPSALILQRVILIKRDPITRIDQVLLNTLGMYTFPEKYVPMKAQNLM